MTVNDLIEKLRAYPGDYRVVVPGYESGIDDIDEPKLASIYLDVGEESWSGPHMLAYEGHPGAGGADRRQTKRKPSEGVNRCSKSL